MSERTGVVVMSRAQAHSCPSTVVDALIQEHRCAEGAGVCRSLLCSDGSFSAPHGCRVVVRSFSLARSLPSALFFVCSQVPSR